MRKLKLKGVNDSPQWVRGIFLFLPHLHRLPMAVVESLPERRIHTSVLGLSWGRWGVGGSLGWVTVFSVKGQFYRVLGVVWKKDCGQVSFELLNYTKLKEVFALLKSYFSGAFGWWWPGLFPKRRQLWRETEGESLWPPRVCDPFFFLALMIAGKILPGK